MDFLKIKETCLYVRDLERARQFYHDRLGLPVISYLSGKHLFLRAGGSVLLLFNPEDSIKRLRRRRISGEANNTSPLK